MQNITCNVGSFVLRREREFSYRDDSQAMYTKACRMRSSHLPPKFDVLLTSYEYPSHDSALLSSIPWSVLVIDEAHRLKNQQSLVSVVLTEVGGNDVSDEAHRLKNQQSGECRVAGERAMTSVTRHID